MKQWSKNEELGLQKKLVDELIRSNYSKEGYEKLYNSLHRYVLNTNRIKGRLYGVSKLNNLNPFFSKTYIQKIIGKNKKVLEIAAGDGFLSIFLSKKGNSVSAIDISDICIEFIKKNLEKYKTNIEIKKCDARDLGFNDNYFDYVVSTDFVEHLNYNDFLVHMTEVKRVLKKGGSYIIITPNKYAYAFEEDYIHLRKYSYYEMNNILRTMGFKTKTLISIIPIKQPLFDLRYKIKLESILKDINAPMILWKLFNIEKNVIIATKKF